VLPTTAAATLSVIVRSTSRDSRSGAKRVNGLRSTPTAAMTWRREVAATATLRYPTSAQASQAQPSTTSSAGIAPVLAADGRSRQIATVAVSAIAVTTVARTVFRSVGTGGLFVVDINIVSPRLRVQANGNHHSIDVNTLCLRAVDDA
jgi:hypothetical protein